jgi:hypothetical protein
MKMESDFKGKILAKEMPILESAFGTGKWQIMWLVGWLVGRRDSLLEGRRRKLWRERNNLNSKEVS